MNEEELCELILENAHVLECFDCGEPLESKTNHAKNNDVVAVLHIDIGEHNYPHSPDEPAPAYFECLECYEHGRKPI